MCINANTISDDKSQTNAHRFQHYRVRMELYYNNYNQVCVYIDSKVANPYYSIVIRILCETMFCIIFRIL